MKLYLPIALVACGVAGCGSTPVPIDAHVSADLDGVYGYTARSGITVAVTGRVSLTGHSDSTVSGSWELSRVPGSDTTLVVGPQIGSGALEGTVLDGTVSVNLNPGWADNNVLLAVRASGQGEWSGTWSHSTIIGPVAGGSVVLHRLTR